MSDDMTALAPRDRALIRIEEDYERRAWTKRLGVSEWELRAAVRAVGPSAAKVKEYLEHRKSVPR